MKQMGTCGIKLMEICDIGSRIVYNGIFLCSMAIAGAGNPGALPYKAIFFGGDIRLHIRVSINGGIKNVCFIMGNPI